MIISLIAAMDKNRVIGKEGKTAKAIRDILRIKGSMHEMKASMKIDAPEFKKEESTEV